MPFALQIINPLSSYSFFNKALFLLLILICSFIILKTSTGALIILSLSAVLGVDIFISLLITTSCLLILIVLFSKLISSTFNPKHSPLLKPHNPAKTIGSSKSVSLAKFYNFRNSLTS